MYSYPNHLQFLQQLSSAIVRKGAELPDFSKLKSVGNLGKGGLNE
jgi:hypothetical protein